MTYNANSKPESRLTVIVDNGKGEGGFSLFVPVFVYGNGAEAAASEVDAGDTIAVDGRLSWKSTLKKDGSKLGLCVSTFGVEVLVKGEVPADVAADVEPPSEPESTLESSTKVRRPRVPKIAQRPWTPSGLVNEN